MTTTNGQVADVVEGVVETRNDHGIRIDGAWHNSSKFHPVDLPDRGTRVRVTLDAKAFIRSIEVLEGAPSPTSSSSTTRDRTIARMCAMKVAANVIGQFAQSHEEVQTAHIFPLADRIFAWITQEEN